VTTEKHSEFVKNLSNQNKLIEFDGNHLQGFSVMSFNRLGDNYISEIVEFLK